MQGEKDEMVQCPYNISHMIIKTRLPSHLIKCRQQHFIEKYTTCPFNSTHDVPAIELEYHVQMCPDKRKLENYIYINAEPETLEVPTPTGIPVSSENWDEEDSQGVSYLDVKDKKLENERVFRLPVGMSKGQRKEFFQSEVLKFEKVRSKENCSYSKNLDSNSCSGKSRNMKTDDEKLKM